MNIPSIDIKNYSPVDSFSSVKTKLGLSGKDGPTNTAINVGLVLVVIVVFFLYLAGAGAAAAAAGAAVLKIDVAGAASTGAIISIIHFATFAATVTVMSQIYELRKRKRSTHIAVLYFFMVIASFKYIVLTPFFASLFVEKPFLPIFWAYLAAFAVNTVGSALFSWAFVCGTGAVGCAAGAVFCAVYGINTNAGAAAGVIVGLLLNPISILAFDKSFRFPAVISRSEEPILAK